MLNPFYLVNWFAKYDCQHNAALISQKLGTMADIDSVIKKYALMFQLYRDRWNNENPGKDYNTMIKAPMIPGIQDSCYQTAISTIDIFSKGKF